MPDLEEDAAAVLQDRPRRGDGVLGDVVRREPRVQDDAGRLVFQKGPRGLFHDSLKLPADLGQEFALGVVEHEFRGAGPHPDLCAVAADQQRLLRRGGDGPQAVQRPAGDERRRRPGQFRQRREGGCGARERAGVAGMVHERCHGAVEVHRHEQVLGAGDAAHGCQQFRGERERGRVWSVGL